MVRLSTTRDYPPSCPGIFHGSYYDHDDSVEVGRCCLVIIGASLALVNVWCREFATLAVGTNAKSAERDASPTAVGAARA
jgi:hypothetical protein